MTSVVRIQPAFGGMNSEASPEYVPATQAAVLENLLARPGKVVLRGPISDDIDLTSVAFDPGYDSPYSRVEGAMVYGSGIIINSGGKNYIVGTTAATTAVTSPGHQFCTLGSYAYSVGSASTADVVRWDGAGGSLTLTNGPENAVDIITHLSRLFTIGTTADANALCWSDQGGVAADLVTYWQDDVSGLTNQIVVGDSDDRARALAHVGRQLAILKDRSIYMLTGLTPSSFSLNRATNEIGCISAESVVDYDEGCFFLSEIGFVYFDGASVTDVSQDIKTELMAAMRDAPFPYSGTLNKYGQASILPFARACSIGRDCIMLVVGRDTTDELVAPTINFCGIYDTKQRTWSRFSSDAFGIGAPCYLIPTSANSYYAGATLGFDGEGHLFYLDDIAAPESTIPSLDGKDTVDGTTASIPVASYSKIIPLSSPTRSSQLKRLLIDYSFVVVSDADSSIDAWSVSLVDGLGTVLLAPTPVQATILASGYTDDQRRAALVRRRFQVEFFAETSEVQLRITLPALDSDVTEVVAAEIHDAHIEFVPGRDRPTI